MRLLEEINQRGTTVIVITHSQEMVDEMNKRIITMERGSVISDVADIIRVLPQRLWRAYGYAYSAGKANEQQ